MIDVDLPWGKPTAIVLPRRISGKGGYFGEVFDGPDHPGGVVHLVISILIGLLL